ncbi:hypothetical protein LINPERHAP2_LOCUS32704 [Linum perenne]
MGALCGHASSPGGSNKDWIPMGTHDITTSISNGIKSLSLSREFKEKLCKPWSNSVVVRLLGKSVGYSFLCHRLHAIWKPMGNIHIVDLDKNYFMVKFANDQDYFKALTGGPWMILDHYLIVHQWDHSFRVSNDLPKKMVAWVRFPHLPIHFYHVEVLTSLGNLVGKTIKIDFNTQRAERGKFSRIAIELDLSEPLPPVVLLDGAHQIVEYENLPTLCFECGRVGHDSTSCPKNAVVSQPPTAAPVEGRVIGPGSGMSEVSADRFGPWMVVSRRQNRPKKESQTKMVFNDPKADLGAKMEATPSSKKESKRGDLAGNDIAGGNSGTKKGKEVISQDSNQGEGAARVRLGTSGGSVLKPSTVGLVGSKPRSKGVTKGKNKKKTKSPTEVQGSVLGPTDQMVKEPVSIGSREQAPTQIGAEGIGPTQGIGDLTVSSTSSIFDQLPVTPVIPAGPPSTQSPSTLSCSRRPVPKKPSSTAILKAVTVVARTSSSGLSKKTTKLRVSKAVKELVAAIKPPPASQPVDLIDLDNKVVSEAMMVEEPAVGAEMIVDPPSTELKSDLSWDLNCPTSD